MICLKKDSKKGINLSIHHEESACNGAGAGEGGKHMIKIRIEGLPEEVEKFTEQLEKDGYEFLQKSENYPNRNSVYVRKYVEIRLKEQE